MALICCFQITNWHLVEIQRSTHSLLITSIYCNIVEQKKNEGTRGKIYFKMSKALEVLHVPAEMYVVYFPLVFENNLLVLTFLDLHLFFAALIFHEGKKNLLRFHCRL